MSLIEMPNMYFACALTHAEPEFVEKMEKWRDEYLSHHFNVMRFAWKDGKPDPEVESVYDYDMSQVAQSSVVVAMLDSPSFGVGMEIQNAINNKIPVIGFATEPASVSKIIKDAFAKNGYPLLPFIGEKNATHEVLIRTVHRIETFPLGIFHARS